MPPLGEIGRRAQLALLHRSVERACRRLGLRGPRISWFSLPVVAPLRGRLGERGSILYYQDRYDAFSHVDAPRLREGLRSLAADCEFVVATSEPLADDLRKLGARPVVVPHGVELERFASPGPPPDDLEGLERPLVGCVGLLDDYVDLEGLLGIAGTLERGTVVLVGASNIDASALRHPRIALLGPRPYTTMPDYMAAFDCCLVPFVVNDLTVGVNPIKLREYLAAGRPAVATRLPATEPYEDVIELVTGSDEFPGAVVRALRAPDDEPARARRRARVAGDSWDVVAERIANHLGALVHSGDERKRS